MYDPTLELLQELDPEMGTRGFQLIRAARLSGVPLYGISGLRSYARNRDVGGAARSQHLAGRALDVAVMGYTREQVPAWWWLALGRYGEGLGLRWGGRFQARDVNHFDLGLQV